MELTPGLDGEPEEVAAALAHGELELVGRLPSSNASFLATVTTEGSSVPVVYKPRRGERPLWDFPDGTLCRREVAAARLSDLLGWGLVPPTVLRDGPFGVGMVQLFIDHDPEEHYFTLLDDHPVPLRRMAVFDVVVNNADRKAGHCLRGRPDGRIWGIDHGLTFHVATKLRTVIWDFAGEPLAPEWVDALTDAARRVTTDALLGALLSPAEVQATVTRIERLLASGCLPEPHPGRHAVPWPLV